MPFRSIRLFVISLSFFWLFVVQGKAQTLLQPSTPTIDLFPLLKGNNELLKSEDYFVVPLLSFSQTGRLFMLEISQFDSVNKSQNQFGEERWGFLNFLLTPHIFGDKLLGEVEMVYSPADNFDIEEELKEYRYQLLRLNLKGTWAGFDYGVEYNYVRDGVEGVSDTELQDDQEGSRLWVERSFNVFHVTAFFSDLSDNVDKDPGRPRTRNTLGGVTMDVEFPSWPVLSLSYSRGSSKNLGEPMEFQSPKNWIETFGASLYYSGSTWDVTLSSTYSLTKDRIQSDVNGTTYSYELSGSYHPTDCITIAPALSLGKEIYKSPGGGVQYVSPTISLWLAYSSLFGVFDFTGFGSYTGYKGSDGFTDTGTIEGTASLIWNLGKSPFGKKSLSFDVSYYHYLDAIYTDSSYKELSILLTLRVASF